MPVLPPTAASTMPSSVVGTCTTRTPRSQVAATKPARSVVAPPPSPTTASVRVKPAAPSASQQSPATASVLAASPSGTSQRQHGQPGRAQRPGHRGGPLGQRRRVDERDLRGARRAARPARRPARRRRRTSYGAAAADRDPHRTARSRRAHRRRPARRRRRATASATSSGVRSSVSTLGDRDLAVERQPLRPAARAAAGRGLPSSSGRSRFSPTRSAAVGMPRGQEAPPAGRPAASRVCSASTAPPPSASTPSCSASASATAVALQLRGTPPRRRRRRCRATGLPAAASTSASVSRNGTPSRSASSRPTVVLPAAGRPDQHDPRTCARSPRSLAIASAVEVAADVAARSRRPSRRRTSPAPRRPAPARPSPRRPRRRPAPRRRRERWLIATAGSPVATSTVASARGTVEIGFIAARTRSTSPVVMPPSVPPARPVRRRSPSGPLSISSCACEPRRRARSNPSPTSTPLIAWMPISAPASRASSRRSPCTWLPRPGGRP